MQISEEQYQWLLQTGGVPAAEFKKNTSDAAWTLSKAATVSLESGLAFPKIIKYISQAQQAAAGGGAAGTKKAELPFTELDSLKELNTPASRIYNWKILADALKRISINLETEQKGQLISADSEELQSLLDQLMQLSNELVASKTKKSKNQEHKEEIDVVRIDVNKDASKCKTCLELFLVLLSRNLALPPTQTASLFTHNCKYLAHLLAKGVKGLFEPIISFFQEMYANVPLLLTLFKEDSTRKNLQFTLNSLKPGLVSKSYEVAQWTARLFSKLAFEFGDNQLLAAGWEWFVGENGGLSMTLLGLKRHPDLRDLAVSVLMQFARFNFIELFTVNLKKAQPEPKDLLNTYLALFQPLALSDASSEEILNSGILDDWIDFAIENASDEFKNSIDARIAALTLLVEIWILLPFKMEEIEDRANAVMSLLNKACREKSSPLVINSLVLLFQLLVHFGQQKSQYAPNIYRTLTLSVIENHGNISIREFAMNNFMTVFEALESIPLNILIEPLVRQIQVTDGVSYFFNVFDFNFFTYISRNERLQLKNAIQLLDLFFKVYLNNAVFAGLASVPILNIVHRFIESETLHEFVIKFVKVALAMFYASEKKKRPKDKVLPLYNGRTAVPGANVSQSEIELEIVQAQKRALIVEMIKSIVAVNCAELNDKIKPLVAHTNIQIKQFARQNSKGMLAILLLFGNADAILEQYEKEYLEHQETLKQNEFESLQTDQLQDGSPIDKTDILKGMDENIKKYSKLTKEEMTHLAYLRNPKADKKVLRHLEQLKQNYNNQEESKKNEIAKQEEDYQKEKVVLRKQLEKRSLEQGISGKNQKDIETALLFSYGTREKQLKRETAQGIPTISYIDLDTEEKRDREMISILLRKYTKALKNIFVKYSNSGFSQQFSYKNLNSFDSIKEKSSMISVPEIYRFIKDYELSDKLSTEEHQSLVRMIALEAQKKKKINGQSSNSSNVAQPQHLQQSQSMVVPSLLKKQSLEPWQNSKDLADGSKDNKQKGNSQNMFEKNQQQRLFPPGEPPEDLRHLPMSASVQKLLDHLKNVLKSRGQSTVLFEDPDTFYFGETDVIKQFNKKLEENPDLVLPQGYKKVKERDLKFVYSLDTKDGKLPIKDSFKQAYAILNDIFKEKFNFFLVEPKSISKEVLRAVPLVGASVDVESHYLDHFKTPAQFEKKATTKREGTVVSQSMANLTPWGKPDSTKTLPSTFNFKQKYGDKRVLEIESNHKLDLGMKLAISTFNYKDRFTAEQVAFCLDDIIKAVESGKDSAPRKRKVDNSALRERQKAEEEKEKQKKKQGKMSKANHEFVIQRAKELLTENEKKEKEKNEKEAIEKAKAEQAEKKKIEGLNQFWKEKKEVLDESKKKSLVEKKKIQEEKLQETKEQKEKKAKEASEFIKKQNEKQAEDYKKLREKEKKDEEEKKKKDERDKVLIEKAHEINVKGNAERVEQEKENSKKIETLIKSEGVQNVIKQNEFKLTHLFDCLKKYTFRELSSAVMNSGDIDYKTFSWFCLRFNFIPEIISTSQASMIYRSLIKNKQVIDLKPVGMNEDDFREALLRIAIKGKKIFNKFGESYDKGEGLNQSAMQQIAEDENKKEEKLNGKKEDDSKSIKVDPQKYVIDDYGNIDEANARTLEMLIHYLGLPNDKIGINEAIKNARENGARPNLILKQELLQKIEKDPKELVRVNRPPQGRTTGKGRNATMTGNSPSMKNDSLLTDRVLDKLEDQNDGGKKNNDEEDAS